MLAGVGAACLYRATTISTSNGARVLARAHPSASAPGAPLIVSAEPGAGRVVVLADSDLFGDDCIGELDHRALWLNIAYWAARSDRSAVSEVGVARAWGVQEDPIWTHLRDHTNALAELQAADGSLAGDADAATGHVDQIAEALRSLAHRFRDQERYIRTRSRTCAAGPPAASASPTSRVRWNPFRPTGAVSTAPCTSCSSRCTSRTARATPASRR